MADGSPCELLATVAHADVAFRTAIQSMLLPAIEAMQTGEQAAVDAASVGVVARLPDVMAAHVPALTQLYDQLEPLVPPEVAVHVVALRSYMGELDDPAGNDAHQAASALVTYRKATCG